MLLPVPSFYPSTFAARSASTSRSRAHPASTSRSRALVTSLAALTALAAALAACGSHSDAPPTGSPTAGNAPAPPASPPPALSGTAGAPGTGGAASLPGTSGAAGLPSAAGGAGAVGVAGGAGVAGATGAAGKSGAGGTAGATGGPTSPSGEACASSIDDAALAPVLKAVGDALAKRDVAALAAQAHPAKGVRFSPYAYVDKRSDVVLKAGELSSAMTDPKVRTWGAHDGSGDPIKLTFAKYFATFVYDRDFVRTGQYARGRTIRTGNTKSNICETYPGAAFVEYHVPGSDPRLGDMGWASLRLVFEASGGKIYLVGIVHDKWTI